MPEDVFRWVITVGVALAAIAFLVQAGIVIGLYAMIKKLQPKITSLTEKAAPLVDTARQIAAENRPKVLEITTSASGIAKQVQERVTPRVAEISATAAAVAADIKPKVAAISTDAVEVVHTVRGRVQHVGELVDDVTNRAHAKVARIDDTVEHTVESAQHVGETVKKGVLKPVKEVNGILSGIKVGIATYASGGRRASVDHATQDEEMFI